MLLEKTNSRYKYKFHTEIEKGNFEIFDILGPSNVNRIMSTYRNTSSVFEGGELNNHTTLHSIISYLEKKHTKKAENDAINKWEDIKKKYINFNLELSVFKQRYSYSKIYSFHDTGYEKYPTTKIEISFTNFNSLLNYKFTDKLINLNKKIFSDALKEVDFEYVIPVYTIKKLHENYDFLNLFLNEMKLRDPLKSLGDGIYLIDFEKIDNKNSLKHFLMLAGKEKKFNSKLLIKAYDYLKENDMNEFLNSLDLDLIDEDKNIVESLLLGMSNETNMNKVKFFLNFIDNKNFDFSSLKLSNIIHFKGSDFDFIKPFIDKGLQYKQYLDFIYRGNNNDFCNEKSYLYFLIKNKLWNWNSENNEGVTFIGYHNNEYNKYTEKDSSQDNIYKNESIYSYRMTFNSLLDFLSTQKQDDILNDLSFLKEANNAIFITSLNLLLKKNFISNEAMAKFLGSENIPEALIDLVSTNLKKGYGAFDIILNSEMQPKFFAMNKEEDFKNFIYKVCDATENITYIDSLNDILNCCIKSNMDKEYLHNTETSLDTLRLYLTEIHRLINRLSYIDFSKINENLNFLINNNNIKDINDDYFISATLEAIRTIDYKNNSSTDHGLNNMKETLNDLITQKKIKFEKEFLSDELKNNSFQELKNKKRL